MSDDTTPEPKVDSEEEDSSLQPKAAKPTRRDVKRTPKALSEEEEEGHDSSGDDKSKSARKKDKASGVKKATAAAEAIMKQKVGEVGEKISKTIEKLKGGDKAGEGKKKEVSQQTPQGSQKGSGKASSKVVKKEDSEKDEEESKPLAASDEENKEEEADLEKAETKASKASKEKKDDEKKPEVPAGPTIKERLAGVMSKITLPKMPSLPQIQRPLMPKIPSMAELKEKARSKLPAMPEIPSVRQYLPDMPTIPKVPLPEPVENAWTIYRSFDEVYVSSVIRPLNYIILLLSLIVIATGRQSAVSTHLLMNPAKVFHLQDASAATSVGKTATFEAELNSTSTSWMSKVPPVQTLLTCQLIDDNLVTLALNLLLLNFIALMNRKSLEFQWGGHAVSGPSSKDFIKLVVFASVLSSMTDLLVRLAWHGVTGANINSSYCSILLPLTAVILGLSQRAHIMKKSQIPANSWLASEMTAMESQPTEFDTGVPFIFGTIKVPYSGLPQVFLVLYFFANFLFEQPMNFRLLFDFYWVWFYLRFFMKTRVSEMGALHHQYQVGDLSQNFSFASFFPERVRQPVALFADASYSIVNMCGLVNLIRRAIERKAELAPPEAEVPSATKPSESKDQKPDESSSSHPPERTTSQERKKAALDFLDEEIQSLNKKQKKKLDPMEAKILAGLSKKASESSGQGVQGDLEFNDLEISFDDKM